MTIQAFPGFKHFTTHHCVTGSLRHIYAFYDYPISEEMLLGLGAGVGFIYWHMKGTLPFIGGRANVGRPGEEGLEAAVGRCTGVEIQAHRTESNTKAEKSLVELLQSNVPVLLILDMGFLPYFDFGGEEYHFGYHAVVACGYTEETQQVLLADRDKELHPVSLVELAKARGSKYKPFPPHNAWYSFDFTHKQPPRAADMQQAIEQCARGMLSPPIRNLGVKGITTAAERIQAWSELLNDKQLRDTCINTAIMIDARGGTGGGLFRKMYARFLGEAASASGDKRLIAPSKDMAAVAKLWDTAAQQFESAYRAADPVTYLTDICELLPQIAQREQDVWSRLLQIVSA